MKVVLLNGSPNEKGCTFTALSEVAKVLNAEGVETEIVQSGRAPVRDCIACCKCFELGGKCVFDDDMVNGIIQKIIAADGLVVGSPVYYAHPSGRILSILNRVFFAGMGRFKGKVAAAVVSARRGGTTASLDAINKHFTISEMPVVSSSYWNMVHGMTPADVAQDSEGLQTMRNLGRNMAWLIKCIDAGKNGGIALPETERGNSTNFIR